MLNLNKAPLTMSGLCDWPATVGGNNISEISSSVILLFLSARTSILLLERADTIALRSFYI